MDDEERRTQLDRLRFVQAVAERAPEVVALIAAAGGMDEAVGGVAALLGVDEATALSGLAQFNLLALTRTATERRTALLAGS